MNSGRLLRWSLVVVAGVFLAAAGSACSHTARINTDPEGAEVFVDGIPIGSSPTLFRTRSGTPATYYVRVRKEGYEELKDVTIDRSYRADVSLLLLLAAIVPYFFSARLEDQYIFHLIPEGGRKAAANTPAAQPQPANWGGAEVKSAPPTTNPLGKEAAAAAPEPPPDNTVPTPPPVPDQLTPPEKG